MGDAKNKRMATGFLWCAVAAYVVSFALPVLDNTQEWYHHMSVAPRGLVRGWSAFLLDGPLALFALCPAWLANPALWLGCWYFSRGRARAALIAAAAGLAFALSALMLLSDDSLVYRQQYLSG